MVVDFASIDALTEESAEGVPGQFVRSDIRSALRDRVHGRVQSVTGNSQIGIREFVRIRPAKRGVAEREVMEFYHQQKLNHD